jgi:hypothetical protein
MVKIKRKDLNSEPFLNALRKLIHTPFPGPIAYKVRQISKEVERTLKEIATEYEHTVLSEFSEKDEHGKPLKSDKFSEGFKVMDSKRDDFNDAHEKFGNTEANLMVQKVSLQELGDNPFTAKEIDSLDPILSVLQSVG